MTMFFTVLGVMTASYVITDILVRLDTGHKW